MLNRSTSDRVLLPEGGVHSCVPCRRAFKFDQLCALNFYQGLNYIMPTISAFYRISVLHDVDCNDIVISCSFCEVSYVPSRCA
jgi:hypothetical protein